MNTLKAIAEALRQGVKVGSDVALARATGLTRQSISRALSGDQNFNVTTLLAIAEANDQVLLLVPREVAKALNVTSVSPPKAIQTLTDDLKGV